VRLARAVLLALPALALGIAGLFHPMHLTYATSQAWWTLHVPGLFVFPLVGVALMALVGGRRDPVALLVVLASFVYATAYSALDVVNGIAAGYVTHRLGPGVPRPDEVRYLFAVGGPFGTVGSVALLVAVLVVLADSLRRVGLSALPAVVLLPGAYLVHVHHIFSPEGVVGMWLVALGTGWLAYVLGSGTRRTATTAARSIGP
jgi:hypothetical protein